MLWDERNERKEKKERKKETIKWNEKISNKWRLYCIWSKCSLSQKFAQQSYWCEFSLTLCGVLPLTLLFERRTCLALLFIYKFEVCPYTMHLSYACVQKNPRTLSHSHFTNTAALFSQQSHSWIATHQLCFLLVESFFFFSSLKFWIEAEKGDKRSRVMMGELGSGREEIKLRQWRRGRHSCLAVDICERVNAAQGAPEVTAGGGVNWHSNSILGQWSGRRSLMPQCFSVTNLQRMYRLWELSEVTNFHLLKRD